MSKLLSLAIILCFFQNLNAQTLQWAVYGHGPHISVSDQISTDNSGNTIIAGNFDDSLSFENNTLISEGSSNCFITKYNLNGDLLWANQISTSGNVTCNGLSTDSSGNIYAGGYFDAPIAIDSINLPLTGTYSYFIAKYSPTGQVLWAVSAGNIFNVYSDLTVDKAGNTYFCGSFYDTLTIGNYVFETTNYMVRSFTVKYDTNGDLIWANQIIGTNNSYGKQLYTNGKSVFLAGGFSQGYYQFDTISLMCPWDGLAYICKYDSTGTALWVKVMGSSAGEDNISSMTTDEVGNLLMTGYSYVGFNLDTIHLNGHPDMFAYAIKLNAAGQVQWLTAVNEPNPGQLGDGESRSYGIGIDNNGRVIIGGYFDLNFRLPGFGTLSTNYYYNLFVLALDSATGNPLAAFQDGGAVGETIARAMALHPDGSIMVTGAFGPGISLQNGPTVMSHGSADVFLAKYSSLVTAAPQAVKAGSLAVTVHPNPATGTVQVNGKSKAGGKTLFTLRDITGRTVSRTQANQAPGAFSQQLDVSELNAGIYLLQVQTNDLSQTLRLVKQ